MEYAILFFLARKRKITYNTFACALKHRKKGVFLIYEYFEC